MKKQLINLEPVKEQVKQKLIAKYDSTLYMNTDTVDIRVDIKEILEEYIKSKNLTEPTIYITTEAYVKMRTLVDKTATEIGWYGTVTKCPGLQNTYVIEDILVYPQKVTGATCEQDDDKMFEFELSLTDDQVNHKRFHGHSHVNMGVTPSGVDEQFYQDILSQVNDYFIITITNKSNAYTVRFYDIENNILYSDVPIVVLNNNGTTMDSWYDEMKSKLSSRITQPTKTPLSGRSYYDDEETHYKTYRQLWDDDEDTVWDSRYGYITKDEKEYFQAKEKVVKLNPKSKLGKTKKKK
jgi:hypothetical protein